MNQCYEGGGFKFCPKADPTDGLLDVIVIAGMPKLKAPSCFPLLIKDGMFILKECIPSPVRSFI